MSHEIFSYGIFGFIALVVAETVLSARWYPAYFRTGLVVFRKAVELPGTSPILPPATTLQAAMKSAWLPSFLFREVSPGEVVFREKLLEFSLLSYTPLMHGHIDLPPYSRIAVVRGRLNWSVIFFVLFFALGPAGEAWFFMLPFLAGVLGLIYIMQASRYRRVLVLLRGAHAAPA